MYIYTENLMVQRTKKHKFLMLIMIELKLTVMVIHWKPNVLLLFMIISQCNYN